MLKSMTGYGAAEAEICGRRLFVEIKAVNHRYFSFQAKTPNNLNMLEGAIQALAKERMSRGQITVFAAWDRKGQGGAQGFSINMEAARQVVEALRAMKLELGLMGDLEVSHVLSVPEVTSQQDANLAAEEVQGAVMAVIAEALDGMERFRAREGEDLEKDLRARLEAFRYLTDAIEQARPKIVAEQKSRLEKRIAELVADKAPEAVVAERLAVEMALFADRCDVSEELVRLRSHMDKLSELLAEKGPVGRKLDFLLQEFNRETNTIGSKTPDAQTARLVVDMKSELEKMREQVQNVE